MRPSRNARANNLKMKSLLQRERRMSVLELLLGPKPELYDWRRDRRAIEPASGERNKYTATHVDNCAIRQVEIKYELSRIRVDAYNQRQLLVIIIGLLILNGAAGAEEMIQIFFP